LGFPYFSVPKDQVGFGQNAVALVPAEIAYLTRTQPIYFNGVLAIAKIGQNGFNVRVAPKNGQVRLSRFGVCPTLIPLLYCIKMFFFSTIPHRQTNQQ
jgi:hypothetical protein